MIGKDIRSVSHLSREIGTSLRTVLINFREYGWCFCKVMNIENKDWGKVTLIFNNHYNYGMFKLSNVVSLKEFDKYRQDLSRQYGRLFAVMQGDYRNNEVTHFICGIVLMPETFDDDYAKFVKDNQKTINPLIHKYGFSLMDYHIMRIYAYSTGSKNYFSWAVNTHYQNRTSINAIKRILWWSENYGQLVKNLSKSTITAYKTYQDILHLFEEITVLKREKRINDVINTFNTAQKKILRNSEISDDDKKVFSNFYRLSESKKLNFIKKMSTITDFKEIMRQMRHVTSTHFSWNKESFMDYIMNVEDLNCEKIYEKDNIILVKVNDFETVKNLAKTTNWCISKNKTYWNQYVEKVPDATQYIMFNFNEKEDALLSIVGFTCKYNKGITNAHNFINDNMLVNDVVSCNSFINSYISHFKKNVGIYNVLEENGIDINLVAKYDKPLFEWNKDSMYKYLYECVKKGNVDILVDKEDLVAISVKDRNIRYFLGDTYIDNTNSEFWSWQHIIFMDFSKNQYDPNRIQYALIKNGMNDEEDYCTNLFNEHHIDSNVSFDSKLSQFGLPYDIIRRIDDKYIRLRDAIQSFNIPILMKESKDKSLLKGVIFDYIGSESMADYIRMSLVDYMTFDYLDIFYNNGYKLTEFISENSISQHILFPLTFALATISNELKLDTIPSTDDIGKFFDRSIDNFKNTCYVGYFLALDKIVANEYREHERNDNLFKGVVKAILNLKSRGEMFDYIIGKIVDYTKCNGNGEFMGNLASYIANFASKELKEKVASIVAPDSKFASLMTLSSKITPVEEDPRVEEEEFDVPQEPAGWAFAENVLGHGEIDFNDEMLDGDHDNEMEYAEVHV